MKGRVVHIRIRVEFNIQTKLLLQVLFRLLPKIVLNNLIVRAVGKEEGRLLVRQLPAGRMVLQTVAQRQVTGETEDTAQLLGVGNAREERHGTALGEAAQDDPRGLDALVDLFLDQSVEVVARTEDSGLILVSHCLFEVQLR